MWGGNTGKSLAVKMVNAMVTMAHCPLASTSFTIPRINEELSMRSGILHVLDDLWC